MNMSRRKGIDGWHISMADTVEYTLSLAVLSARTAVLLTDILLGTALPIMIEYGNAAVAGEGKNVATAISTMSNFKFCSDR